MKAFALEPCLALCLVLATAGCSFSNGLDDLKGAPGGGGVGGAGGSGATAGDGAAGSGGSTVSAVPPLRGLVTGGSHACVIDSTDRAFCWGDDKFGQLGGDAPTDSAIVPTLVPSLTGVKVLAAGNFHTCAVASEGTLCWGEGSQGQLGDGKSQDSKVPVKIAGAAQLSLLTGGGDHTCGVGEPGGKVFCWGANTAFQSAGSDPTLVPTPVEQSDVSGATAVAAGAEHSCAVDQTGLRCWGANDKGQLGTGDTVASNVPVAVTGISGVKRVAANSRHTCATNQSDTLRCWGANAQGQIGNGSTNAAGQLTPTSVSFPVGVASVSAVAVGGSHTCAVAGGAGYCWGSNVTGQLGDGTQDQRPTPTAITLAGSLTVTEIAAGAAFTCALVKGGTALTEIWCWGTNGSGQAGNSTGENQLKPVKVALQP